MPLSRLAKLLERKSALAVGLAVVAGLASGLLLLPRAHAPDGGAEPLPQLSLLGQKLKVDDGANKQALERARRYAARW